MAARAAFDSRCATSPSPATPRIQAGSASKRCVVRWRESCSPRRGLDISFNSISSGNHDNICAFRVSRGNHSAWLPRRCLPLAAVAAAGPRRNGSLGVCAQHFALLALACECDRNRAANSNSARSAKGFMVFEEVGGDFGGSDCGNFGKRRQVRLIANAEKKKKGGISFGDQLLDYIEGGPKLRRWYGAPDQLPKDGRSGNLKDFEEMEEEEADVVRDAVLVTDADSETGQLVVLELILRRLKVVALVKDIKAATVGFGAYVQPVEGDVNDRKILKKIIKGIRAIICPAKIGQLADQELVRGVEHLILLSKLSVSRNQSGLGSLFGRRSKREAEENEAAVSSSGIPYTIIRAGTLNDDRGGDSGFLYGQGGEVDGTIRREDAAYVCVEALDSPPQRALVFEVVNGTDEVEDWSAVFTSMKEGQSG